MEIAERLGTPIQGHLTEMVVDVVEPYRGSDTEAVLEIGRVGPGSAHDLGRIDVRMPGRRSVSRTAVTGASGADRWRTPLPDALWTETLVLHLRGDQPVRFVDAAATALPRIGIEVAAS